MQNLLELFVHKEYTLVRLGVSDGDGRLVRECLEQIRIVAEVGAPGALGANYDQPEQLPLFQKGCSHLGIEVTASGPDWLEGRMPVDARTRQPMGILHGGASVVLAESSERI